MTMGRPRKPDWQIEPGSKTWKRRQKEKREQNSPVYNKSSRVIELDQIKSTMTQDEWFEYCKETQTPLNYQKLL